MPYAPPGSGKRDRRLYPPPPAGVRCETAPGGPDAIRNLWPHSYSAAWNAHVKDDLEDRLRDMVCSGNMDLGEAQQEIAANWIAAYKKYFHTDKPIAHVER